MCFIFLGIRYNFEPANEKLFACSTQIAIKKQSELSSLVENQVK